MNETDLLIHCMLMLHVVLNNSQNNNSCVMHRYVWIIAEIDAKPTACRSFTRAKKIVLHSAETNCCTLCLCAVSFSRSYPSNYESSHELQHECAVAGFFSFLASASIFQSATIFFEDEPNVQIIALTHNCVRKMSRLWWAAEGLASDFRKSL